MHMGENFLLKSISSGFISLNAFLHKFFYVYIESHNVCVRICLTSSSLLLDI